MITNEPLAHELAARLGHPVTTMTPLGGGDVNDAYRVGLDDGTTIFAKTHPDPPPGFFATEAAGLSWLADAQAVPVPTVLAVADGDRPLLALEWVDEGGAATTATEEAFGRALAALHRSGAPTFGREDRATTGSRRLPNEPCESWPEFYATQRLEPLARLAADSGALGPGTIVAIGQTAARIDDLVGPPEPPARLHGDLWAGNRLVDTAGRSWLIDPAAHGGHREFDLAMMQLFGGFGPTCFSAYDEAYPLADGWTDRISLHQLSPLIVHAIKFGGPYVAAVDRALALLH